MLAKNSVSAKAIIVKDIKLDFKVLPQDDPTYLEVKMESPMMTYQRDGAEAVSANFKESVIAYYRERVWHPEAKEFVNYYVKTDSIGIFRDLLLITDGHIQRKIEDAMEKVRPVAFMQGEEAERDRIRDLPWYKRLFNRF